MEKRIMEMMERERQKIEANGYIALGDIVALNTAQALLDNNELIPNEILLTLAKLQYYACYTAEMHIKKGIKIPDIIVNTISNNVYNSFNVAYICKKYKQPIPNKILEKTKEIPAFYEFIAE